MLLLFVLTKEWELLWKHISKNYSLFNHYNQNLTCINYDPLDAKIQFDQLEDSIWKISLTSD